VYTPPAAVAKSSSIPPGGMLLLFLGDFLGEVGYTCDRTGLASGGSTLAMMNCRATHLSRVECVSTVREYSEHQKGPLTAGRH
jgi:hypothetical protein